MPDTDAAGLIKKIRSGELSGVYYIYGRDTLSVAEASRAILKKRLGKDWENSYTKLDGGQLDVGALCGELEICPMFTDCSAFLINDLNAEELSSDDLKQLIAAIEELPDFSLLVFNITGFDIKNGKKTFTAKNKKLIDSIRKKGTVCECGIKTLPALGKDICEAVKKRGLEISRKNAETLCEYCLMDTVRIRNEIDKLCSYRESGEITLADIEMLVPGEMETDAFRFARAVISLNAGQAFVLLNELLEKRNEPIAVISAVSMSFTDLYRAKCALSSGRQSADMTADFGYRGREFAVNNAFRDCRRISASDLRRCVGILRDADRTLKSSKASARVILERSVTKMLMAVRGS